jgi:ubiquitin carboxyl-terminal hydrolase 9/13
VGTSARQSLTRSWPQFGSTCYCNSIIQCLYYSVPFREQVINFPSRSPPDALENSANGPLPRLNTDLLPLPNGQSTLSPKPRNSLSLSSGASPRKAAPAQPNGAPNGQLKPEDNKESPEYKKKAAIAAGPVVTMDYENSKAYGMSESLFTSLKDIFEAIIAHRSRIGVVSPNKFLEILRRDNEMFRTPMHQDAHEFLNLLLNEVVENVEKYSNNRITEAGESDLNGTTVTSGHVVPATSTSNTGWVHELFEGTLTSETRCLTCENTSQRDEAFLDLSVDLEQHSSVTSCLRKFSEEEMLCERNKFHCDNCGGLQEAEKRMKIKRLPKILALHLKRFKYTEDLQRLQKLFHRVVYPYYLRLFNTTDDAEDPDRLYELYAIVVHIGGGPYHGHYVSIIKTQDRGWLLFDDEMVEPVDKAYVKNFFGGEGVLACAYVLFYQETTVEAMQREQEAEGLAAATQTTDVPTEPVAVSPKTNGNGVANGDVFHPATTPTTEREDQFANLDHAKTAPPIPATHHTPDHTTPNPPILTAKKSNLFSSKHREKAKEEKERKAAEKEVEKANNQKRKEAEQTRRDNFRKQADDLRAALDASKESHKEEKLRRRDNPDVTDEKLDVVKERDREREKDKDKENGFGSVKASGLSRFRHSSMSLRSKPKFWPGNKEKGEAGAGTENEAPTMPVLDRFPSPSANGTPDKQEKEKGRNRFSLGRKKSTFNF